MAPTGEGAIGQAKAQAQAIKQAENQTQLDDPLAERRSATPMTDTAGALHQESQISDEVPEEYSAPPQLTDERYQADPERWIEDIRQRWLSGRRDEAIRQLVAFRHVHPQYPLPEDLALMH